MLSGVRVLSFDIKTLSSLVVTKGPLDTGRGRSKIQGVVLEPDTEAFYVNLGYGLVMSIIVKCVEEVSESMHKTQIPRPN